jgi:hydrogenase maturation protease
MNQQGSTTLVIGLGNPLMGDDGIGSAIAERLKNDPRLPSDVAVISGVMDLLRLEDQIEGRARVILLDALVDPTQPGAVTVLRDCFGGFELAQEHAHALSALQGVELLRLTNPGVRRVAFTFVGIGVAAASFGAGLSPLSQGAIGLIVERLIEDLSDTLMPR